MPGREEALQRATLATRARSLQQLQGQFTDSWFPSGEAFSEPIVRLHDAAHQWSNISPSLRGELQQNVVDFAGGLELYKRTGARGIINSFPFRPGAFDADDLDDDIVGEGISQLVRASKGLDHPLRGVDSQDRLPPNDPARLQVPPLSIMEARELAKRGTEFYGKVSDAMRKGFPELPGKEARNVIAGYEDFSPAPGLKTELPVNAAALALHSERGGELRVGGGYDGPGQMSYGPMQARLNRPLQYTVDQGLLMHEAAKEFRREVEQKMGAPRLASASPEKREQAEALIRRTTAQRLGLPLHDFDVGPGSPFAKAGQPGDSGASAEAVFKQQDRAIRDAKAYGAGQQVSALRYVMDGFGDGASGGSQNLEVATRARALAKVRNAISRTTTGAAALGGALPLVSPSVWGAVGRKDYSSATREAAAETGVALAASPVIGAAGGALQRVAPAVAPAVGRTLGAAGLAALPTQAVQSYSAYLEGRTGKGLPVRVRGLQDTQAGMTSSMQAESPRRSYPEGWVTVPGRGRRWRDEAGNFYLQQPGLVRTAPAQTARQVIPQLFPTPRSVPARTPSGVARLTKTRPPSAMDKVKGRLRLAGESFNPGEGDFGISELFFGR